MSRPRQDVLKIYFSSRNQFHQKARVRIDALKHELGMGESEIGMHLLLLQVLDETEKAVAGLMPTAPTTLCRSVTPDATHAPPPPTSIRNRADTAPRPSAESHSHPAPKEAAISEEAVDRILSPTATTAEVAPTATQGSAAHSSRRAGWIGLSRTTKPASNE